MKNLLLILVIALVAGCRENYELPVQPSEVSMLVVEGSLNPGGATSIVLSKTMKLSERAQFKPELKAQVTVEGKDNSRYVFSEMGSGTYSIGQLNIQFGKEYRARIRTADGRQYISEYVSARKTPVIDSVNWRHNPNGGIDIYVNTHDPFKTSRYYKWDFNETWEIRSTYEARYKWVTGTTIIPMPVNERYSVCWKYANSTELLLGSSEKLQADVIYEKPLIHIDNGSEKIGERYSILVKQQSLSKEAYDYFLLMKKNTEMMGSIFDPQPSELYGNIHNVANPSEIVVGFLDISSVEEKRIFITYREAGWRYILECDERIMGNNPAAIANFVPVYLPWDAIMVNGSITSYNIALAACVDCRERGGSLIKPSYW